MVVYVAHTVLVSDAPGAEFVTVEHGRISRMRIIFDRLPFEAARRSASRVSRPAEDGSGRAPSIGTRPERGVQRVS